MLFVVVEVRLLQGSFEFEYGGRAGGVEEEQEAGSTITDAASKGGSSALDRDAGILDEERWRIGDRPSLLVV